MVTVHPIKPDRLRRFFITAEDGSARGRDRISEYLAFSATLLLAFGITFEMPIFAFFLTRVGAIEYRMMIRYFRYAVLAIFVVAVAPTPPDMISPFLLAIPCSHSMA
ncbi:MAG: twin-arginine translocase subunit TatC [Candidatus Binataceae bacterium]|jgi:sec-independent protein translocase protein TatC